MGQTTIGRDELRALQKATPGLTWEQALEAEIDGRLWLVEGPNCEANVVTRVLVVASSGRKAMSTAVVEYGALFRQRAVWRAIYVSLDGSATEEARLVRAATSAFELIVSTPDGRSRSRAELAEIGLAVSVAIVEQAGLDPVATLASHIAIATGDEAVAIAIVRAAFDRKRAVVTSATEHRAGVPSGG